MLKILTVIVATMLSAVSYGQKNLEATWGAWGEISSDFTQYINFGKSFEDTTGHLLLSVEGRLDAFDANLNKGKSVHLFGASKDVQILAAARMHKKPFIVTAEKQQSIKLYKYNAKTGVAEFEKDLIVAKKLGKVFHTESPDSSMHLFWTCIPGKSISFYVFDSLFKPQWERLDLPVQSMSDWFYSPQVNNTGIVAFADTDKENFLVRVLSDKGKTHKSKGSMLINNKYVNTVSCVSSNTFAFVLLYNKDNVNYSGADKLQTVFVDGDANPLAYAEVSLPGILRDRMVMRISPMGGYKLRVVMETFSNTRKETSNQCIYGAFNVLGIDAENSALLWHQEIFKNLYFVAPPQTIATPFSNEYRDIYGHGFYEYKDVIYLFYADNCHNCGNINSDFRSQSSMKTSCLAMISIDSKGSVARHTYSSLPTVKYQIDAASFVQVDAQTVIVKNNAIQQRIAAVKLNRLDE